MIKHTLKYFSVLVHTEDDSWSEQVNIAGNDYGKIAENIEKIYPRMMKPPNSSNGNGIMAKPKGSAATVNPNQKIKIVNVSTREIELYA